MAREDQVSTHADHPARFDATCAECWSKATSDNLSWTAADPLTVDEEPSCCELACYEDPGCACDGCRSVDDEVREQRRQRRQRRVDAALLAVAAAIIALLVLLAWTR